MIKITDTVKHILIINIILFIGVNILKNIVLAEWLVLHFPLNPNFRVWQALTSMFMHLDFNHLLFNMILFVFVGSILELSIGSKKFIILYIISGFGGDILSIIVDYFQYQIALDTLIDAGLSKSSILSTLDKGMYKSFWTNVIGENGIKNLVGNYNNTSLGASGAIMGVVAAVGYTYPNQEVVLMFPPIPIKLKFLVIVMVISDLISAILTGTPLLAGSNIGYMAHLGGALTGFLLILFWKKNTLKKYRIN